MIVTSTRSWQEALAPAGGTPRSLASGRVEAARRLMGDGGPLLVLSVAAARLTAPLARWGRLCFFRSATRDFELPRTPWIGREARADELLDGVAPDRRAEILDRYESGHRCFVVTEAGRVVSFAWSARCRARIPEVGLDVIPADDGAYFYDGFSLPRWRGSGVFQFLRCFVFRKMREEGVDHIHFYVRGDNPRSCRRTAHWASPAGTLLYFEPRGGRCRVYIPASPSLPSFALPAPASLEGRDPGGGHPTPETAPATGGSTSPPWRPGVVRER